MRVRSAPFTVMVALAAALAAVVVVAMGATAVLRPFFASKEEIEERGLGCGPFTLVFMMVVRPQESFHLRRTLAVARARPFTILQLAASDPVGVALVVARGRSFTILMMVMVAMVAMVG